MTAPDRTPLDYRPTAPCLRCHATCSYLDLLDGIRCDHCTDHALRRLSLPRNPRPAPVRPGPVLRALTLLLLLAFVGAFWALVLLGGQAVTCAAWDQRLAYCSEGQR